MFNSVIHDLLLWILGLIGTVIVGLETWILVEIVRLKVVISAHDKQIGRLEAHATSERGTLQRTEDRINDDINRLETRIYALEQYRKPI